MHAILKDQSLSKEKAATIETLHSLVVSAQVDQEGAADNVFNSQESVLTYDGGEKAMEVAVNVSTGKTSQDEEPIKDDQPNIRRSERLKKEVHLTTSEKNESMAKKRNLEGNSKLPRNLSDVDNLALNNIAKSMGVIVQKNNIATFSLLRDLESARNCLYLKQQKLTNNSILAEIVGFDPENDDSIEVMGTDDDSDIDEMLLQKSLKKNSSSMGKFKFSQGGKFNVCIPVSLNKRKKQRKNGSAWPNLEL